MQNTNKVKIVHFYIFVLLQLLITLNVGEICYWIWRKLMEVLQNSLQIFPRLCSSSVHKSSWNSVNIEEAQSKINFSTVVWWGLFDPASEFEKQWQPIIIKAYWRNFISFFAIKVRDFVRRFLNLSIILLNM